MMNSLKLRMALGVAAFTLALLSFTAFTLYQAYERSLAKQLSDGLQVHIYSLIAAAEFEQQQLQMPISQLEPRLNQPESGLSAWVANGHNALLWRSLSLAEDSVLPATVIRADALGQFNASRIKDDFYQSYQVMFEGYNQPVSFVVWDNGSIYRGQLDAFRTRLVASMVVVAVVLALAVAGLMAWSLHPLQSLVKEIEQIDIGQQDHIKSRYPLELSPVVRSVNQLLDTQTQQRQRYRNTLADLAHSFKTPLAVLTNELAQAGELVQSQLRRMQDIITYQLSRAVKSGKSNNASAVDVAQQIQRLIQTLNKAYYDKSISVQFDAMEREFGFQGDQQDLLELAGNVLENAYKYGHSKVQITLSLPQPGQLCLQIDDDGEGFSEAPEQILQRGVRGDTVAGGQGIGLSVVVDIVDSYMGSISLSRSSLGGGQVRINLPATSLTHQQP